MTVQRTDRSAIPRGLLVVASSLVLAALPIFMVGGFAVQIRADLALTEATLGAVVTAGFLAGALAAPLGGWLSDRVGPRTSVLLGTGLSTIALLGIALIAHGWLTLATFLVVAGLAIAVTDPGLAILVGQAIPEPRHGLAFGVKEASIPAATLMAGLAVPVIALTLGWRWGFALGAVPLLIVITQLRRVLPPVSAVQEDHETRSTADVTTHVPRGPVAMVAVAAIAGTAAASGVGVFLTESAVAMGLSEAGAGLLLATGSVAGIVARITAGVSADRTGGTQFGLISTMLAVGAVTIALGGTGNTALLIVGTVGAFTGGWAWTGIFFLSLVKTYPHRPGAAAGIGTASLGLGNALGPILFGITAQALSFGAAWVGAALVAGLGAVVMARANKRLPPDYPDALGPGESQTPA